MCAGQMGWVRGLAASATMLAAGAGCAINGLWEATREEVLQRVLPSAVQVVLERNGERFRTGSGVAIAARRSGAGADCFVLTSGHTVSRLPTPTEAYVLFGRHRGAGTRARATGTAPWPYALAFTTARILGCARREPAGLAGEAR